jgi:hypothetical protein
VTPYVSTADADAVPGQAPGGDGGGSRWLMGSALSSFILGRRAGFGVDFPREHGDWPKRPLVLMPSPLTSTGTPFLTHVQSSFYERAREYVRGGGVLYASVAADAAVPDMASLFGARLADANVATEIALRVVAPLGSLKAGDTLRFVAPGDGVRHWGALLDVEGGQVIAVDQDDRPALVAHTLGAGKTLLCAYPLESYLATAPAAFEREPALDRLYRAIREWSGVRPDFLTDHPSVEAVALKGPRSGYAVLVNHSAEAREVTVRSSLPLTSVRQIRPEGPKPLDLRDGSWRMELEAYEGAIVAWQ